MSRLVPFVVLLVGSSVAVIGGAQGVGSVTPGPSAPNQGSVQVLDTTVSPALREALSLDASPWTRDSLGETGGTKEEALGAAWIDPGILIYAEPPPGTNMPIQVPPKNVDPEMVWLYPHNLRNLRELGRLKGSDSDQGGARPDSVGVPKDSSQPE